MKNKYFIREMPCYTKTTLEQRKKIPPGAYFHLKALPTEGLRTEFYEFLKKRGREVEATTMYSEVWRYDAISAFLAKRAKRVQSLQEREPEVWLRQLRAWLLEEGYRLTVSAVSEYGKEKVLPSTVIRYFRMVICDRRPEDEREETEKDVWRLDKLEIPIKENLIRNDMTLNFTRIPQEKIRAEAKKGIYLNLRSEAIDTIRKEIHAIQRFAGYLEEKQPRVQSWPADRPESAGRISGLVPHRDPEERLPCRTDTASEYPGQHRESLRLPPTAASVFKYRYPIHATGRVPDLHGLGYPEI